MKTLKLLSLLAIPIATIPFILTNKYKITTHATYSPIESKIGKLESKVDKLEETIDKLEKKIDKAQLCKVKKDIEELKKIVYALIGVVGGSGALVGTTNLVKKKK